jgi:hypothetical protein
MPKKQEEVELNILMELLFKMKSHSFIIQINILFLIPFSSGFPLTEYASLVFAMMRVNSTKSKTNVQYQILASYIRLQFSRKFIRKKRRSLYAQRKKN